MVHRTGCQCYPCRTLGIPPSCFSISGFVFAAVLVAFFCWATYVSKDWDPCRDRMEKPTVAPLDRPVTYPSVLVHEPVQVEAE